MIDSDLQTLLAQPPDHALDRLRADIWAGVSERERRATFSRRLAALQSAVLIAVLVASLLAGAHYRRASSPGPLDIFSPHMALSMSTRLAQRLP